MLVDTVTITEPEKAPPFGVIAGVTTWSVFVKTAVETELGNMPPRKLAAFNVSDLVSVMGAV